MMLGLGLKRNEVKLVDHNPEWEILAAQTIAQLWDICGLAAEDIQHCGSTAIRHIKAKPDMYITVGVKNMDATGEILPRLREIGITRIENRLEDTILCAMDSEIKSGVHTLYVHILPHGCDTWNENIIFKDYMNSFPQKAAAYEDLKIRLAEQYPSDRRAYKNGKIAFFKEYFLEARIYNDFKQKLGIATLEPLNKGWSNDKKYVIKTTNGKMLLLRIADIAEHDRKKSEYEMMQTVYNQGIPMSQPLDFGTCAGGDKVYQLLSWIEGEDAITALPLLSDTQQYLLGISSGKILRKIHSIPAPINHVDWETRFNKKIDNRIIANKECADAGLTIDGIDHMQNYVENNRHLLKNRPQCFQHGDYHVGNMLVKSGELAIIDFNRYDFGDPWEEFNRIVFCAAVSPHFATGQLNGYFDGKPPEDFFKLLALYIATNQLGALCWARTFGEEEMDFCRKQAADVLAWYSNMQNIIPTWYLNT